MITRLFAIPAGLVVLVLVAAAMFRGEPTRRSTQPTTIEPGKPAPHEERGLCAACHLLGGGPTHAGMAAAVAKKQGAPAPPPIRANEVRPHGERGSCVNCHEVLPLSQTTAAGSQLAGAATLAPFVTPMMPPAFGYALPASPMPANGAMVTQAPQGAAPPIPQGAVAPHGWRGPCPQCHTVGNVPKPWQPTPPLAAQQPAAPRRDPREAEALGMTVNPATGAVEGMKVVEVEGPARKVGLKAGDVIRAIDGNLTADIQAFLDASRAGDLKRGIVVDLVRQGEAQAVVLR